MHIEPILEQLTLLQKQGKTSFISSSFQSQSVVLLHIISQIDIKIPVFFINTGYHFPETIVHKNKIASLLGLNLHDLVPMVSKNLQKDNQGNLLFTFDPDYCCYLNKVQPMERLLDTYDVWISGVRREQNHDRKNLALFQKTQSKAVRYHPLLEWTTADMDSYMAKHNLPVHPLEADGYKSIGCEPCTFIGNQREGRWYGLKKTECGLNTTLIRSDKLTKDDK
jgi:phosphoadenosine phosphosulfate reductase